MTRRRFLAVLAGIAAVAVTQKTRLFAAPTKYAVAVQLTQVFTHRSKARMVGREYLKLCSQEANLVALVSALRQNGVSRRASSVMTAIQRDFSHGRTVTIRGWVVAVTEARLCALTCFV